MRGWRLREGWEGADGGSDRPSALDTDLAACGEAVLPKEIAAAAVDSIPGPVVLQLLKVKNVSAPTENQGSGHAPRMLKLQLTDGHTKCFGLELDPPIKGLSLDTPPGTKLLLDQPQIVVRGGFLVLPRTLQVLGGRVPELYDRWKLQRDLGGHARELAVGEDGPPRFATYKPPAAGALGQAPAASAPDPNTSVAGTSSAGKTGASPGQPRRGGQRDADRGGHGGGGDGRPADGGRSRQRSDRRDKNADSTRAHPAADGGRAEQGRSSRGRGENPRGKGRQDGDPHPTHDQTGRHFDKDRPHTHRNDRSDRSGRDNRGARPRQEPREGRGDRRGRREGGEPTDHPQHSAREHSTAHGHEQQGDSGGQSVADMLAGLTFFADGRVHAPRGHSDRSSHPQARTDATATHPTHTHTHSDRRGQGNSEREGERGRGRGDRGRGARVRGKGGGQTSNHSRSARGTREEFHPRKNSGDASPKMSSRSGEAYPSLERQAHNDTTAPHGRPEPSQSGRHGERPRNFGGTAPRDGHGSGDDAGVRSHDHRASTTRDRSNGPRSDRGHGARARGRRGDDDDLEAEHGAPSVYTIADLIPDSPSTSAHAPRQQREPGRGGGRPTAATPAEQAQMAAELAPMGFTPEQIDAAVTTVGPSEVEAAVDWLLSGGGADSAPPPSRTTAIGGGGRGNSAKGGSSSGHAQSDYTRAANTLDRALSNRKGRGGGGGGGGGRRAEAPRAIRYEDDHPPLGGAPAPAAAAADPPSWGPRASRTESRTESRKESRSEREWAVGDAARAVHPVSRRVERCVIVAPKYQGAFMCAFEGDDDLVSLPEAELRGPS